MELNEVLKAYESCLSHYLFSSRRNRPRTAQKLSHLVNYAIEICENTDLKYYRQTLKQNFERFALWLLDKDYFSETSWQDFVLRQCDYNIKLHNLKEHIQRVDQEGQLWRYLKNCFIKTCDSQLQSIFNEICECYIFISHDCKPALLQIYKSIYDYDVEMRFDGNVHMAMQKGRLFDCGAKILSCIEGWVKVGDRNFCEVYTVWKNAMDLLALTSFENSKISGMHACFKDDPGLLLKSLDSIVLSPDAIITMYNFSDNDEWKVSFANEFFKVRHIKWNGDFDKILGVIFSSDSFGSSRGIMFPDGLRKGFQKSVKDVTQLHVDLLNYLDVKFQNNYSTVRRIPSTSIKSEETNWIKALTTFLVYYLPQRQEFIKLYLRKGLFRQMVMLGSKFPLFYNHEACLERILIENMNNMIPKDVQYIRATLEHGQMSLKNSTRVRQSRIVFNKLYLPSEVAQELSLSAMTPIWPTHTLEGFWNEETKALLGEGKVLHGSFDKHLIFMKLPLSLSNGKKITLVTTLSVASILYLYNDSDAIEISKLHEELSDDKEQELLLASSLRKLLHQGLVLERKKGLYTFNYNFKPNSTITSTGFITII